MLFRSVLAEKLETVISRGDQNTRPRDYYDVCILKKLQFENISIEALRQAITATSQKRGSYDVLANYNDIMTAVKNSPAMQEQWKAYQQNFEYAADVDFEDACDTVVQIMDEISILRNNNK